MVVQGFEKYWINLRSSLWFVPALMVAASMALAFGLIELDSSLDPELARSSPRLFGMSPDGARGILVAIATSMITVTGVTFSMMIVALSLASNQYSPRILRNFMQDTGTKIVLGIFVSVFAYSLIVMRAVRSGENAFVPPLSMLMAIALSLVSIGFLVYFVHHISAQIQVATIVANIATETVRTILELYPASEPTDLPLPPLTQPHWNALAAQKSGYLQSIDPALVRCATENDLVVRVAYKMGSFIVEGSALAWIAGTLNPKNIKAVRGCFGINTYRTIDQDPDFGVRQLVDIALRALSPAINDTSTAINCVDRLGQILHVLVQRYDPPSSVVCTGHVRVIWKSVAITHLIDQCFHQIRQSASANPAVLMRLLSVIGQAGAFAVRQQYRDTLEKHLALLEQVTHRIDLEHDRNVILERAKEVRRQLRQNNSAAAHDSSEHG